MPNGGENSDADTSQTNISYLSWHGSIDSVQVCWFTAAKSLVCVIWCCYLNSFNPGTSTFLLCSWWAQEIKQDGTASFQGPTPHLWCSFSSPRSTQESVPTLYLQGAAEHADHQHGHREVVGEHIPPGLQHAERRLLLRELPELGHGNHPPAKQHGQLSLCRSHPSPCESKWKNLLWKWNLQMWQRSFQLLTPPSEEGCSCCHYTAPAGEEGRACNAIHACRQIPLPVDSCHLWRVSEAFCILENQPIL